MRWRAAWARSWEEVATCSTACRRRGRRPVDDRLEVAIVDLLCRRAHDATICPSEAARLVDPGGWRSLMEPARAAARRLAARSVVEIRQNGRRVDPSTAKGPVRVARGAGFATGPTGGSRTRAEV
jgi:hypothetical protein